MPKKRLTNDYLVLIGMAAAFTTPFILKLIIVAQPRQLVSGKPTPLFTSILGVSHVYRAGHGSHLSAGASLRSFNRLLASVSSLVRRLVCLPVAVSSV
jgi:hypothetical protein